MFGLIDRAMKDYYLGQRAETLVPGMPPGVIGGANRWVKSAPIVPPGCASACRIRGRVDVLVDCDDGMTAVVDFKTGEPGLAAMEKYSRQLHAYALALEHSAKGPATAVSALGLMCFSPDGFETHGHEAALTGGLTWTEVPLERPGFIEFLSQVLSVLGQPEAPPLSSSCPWCKAAAGSIAA